MRKLKKLIMRMPIYVWQLICLFVFYIIGYAAKLIFPKYRNVWIVAERGEDARDNGYFFYKYVRQRHPEINAYYIIDKMSVDYHKVASLGNVIQYKSFLHHLLFAVSTHKISSHIFGYSPDVLCYNKFQKLGLIRGKIIFLQHGIIKDDMKWMFYPNTVLDLFVCGAKPEYEAIKSRYGYPDGVVKYLGLCRYDALLEPHEVKKRILLMPTWRIDICEVGNRGNFTKSKYYRAYQNLINNPKLISFLENNDYELVFYPHFEIQRFLGDFSSESSRVTIASFKEYDVQELLMSSKMLITDFSSVFFDFAYMGKPVVYYQFDEKEYRENQYDSGYFSYRRDGFGPVFDIENETVDYVIEEFDNGFSLEKIYAERAENFFEFRDNNNCKRNFDAVASI